MSGSIPPTSDGSAAAYLGFHLDQDESPDASTASDIPISDGLQLSIAADISNLALETVWLYSLDGVTDPSNGWCSTGGNAIDIGYASAYPWDAFRAGCRNASGGGASYGHEPLSSVTIAVTGCNTSTDANCTYAQPFNFCVNSFREWWRSTE